MTTYSPNITIANDKAALSRHVAVRMAEVSKAAIDARGVFNVAVSGGSLPKILTGALVDEGEASRLGVDWSRWNVFLADERCVARESEDSNGRLVREMLVKKVGMDEKQLHEIEQGLSPEETATAYYKRMLSDQRTGKGFVVDGQPIFDSVLLGLGPDGHTASLFPEHPLLAEKSKAVASILDSPKPPPERITLTLPTINAARHIAFICTGSSKADVVHDIMENKESTLPGRLVNPTSGNLDWFLDAEAASKLEKPASKV